MKYRLIQEHLYNGPRYSIEEERDGRWLYVTGTVTRDRLEAEQFFSQVGSRPLTIVLSEKETATVLNEKEIEGDPTLG